MISHTTQNFRCQYANLPEQVRKQAENAYLKFRENPNHPGVRFKCVKADKSMKRVFPNAIWDELI